MTRERSQSFLPVLGILVLYLLVALYGLDRQSLWGDEVRSVMRAGDDRSLLQILGDAHGPVHVLALHVWMKSFGASDAVLRLLSVLIGATVPVLTYFLGVRWVGRRAGAIAGILASTSPLLIWYCHEVRYVVVGMAAVALSYYLLENALSGNRPHQWLAYAGSVALVLFSSVASGFMPVAQGMGVLLSPSLRRRWVQWCLAMVVAFLVVAPWFYAVYFSKSHALNAPRNSSYSGKLSSAIAAAKPNAEDAIDSKGLRIPVLKVGVARESSIWELPYTLFSFSAGFSMGSSIRELHLSRSMTQIYRNAPVLIPLALLFGTLLTLGLSSLQKSRSKRAALMLTWLFLPMLLVYAVAAMTENSFNVRYVAGSLPAYLILIATGITRVGRSWIQTVLLASVLLANGVSLANYHSDPRYQRADARAAAAYIESECERDDVVLLVGNGLAWNYYFKGQCEVGHWSLEVNSLESEVLARVQVMAEERRRVWLVQIRPWETDPDGNVRAVLEGEFNRVQSQQFAGVDILRFEPRPAKAPVEIGSQGTESGE